MLIDVAVTAFSWIILRRGGPTSRSTAHMEGAGDDGRDPALWSRPSTQKPCFLGIGYSPVYTRMYPIPITRWRSSCLAHYPRGI